jgi:hypothetical protein
MTTAVHHLLNLSRENIIYFQHVAHYIINTHDVFHASNGIPLLMRFVGLLQQVTINVIKILIDKPKVLIQLNQIPIPLPFQKCS